ncbi:Ig-like domain-containing protein [Winogradskyella pulchriflava]|uniref:Ig-like domain-containing protein n=1 Tax=Winogradskyella pulchriflava TaxID=1110688 RepID=A0ABV6Q7W1_9FLAO
MKKKYAITLLLPIILLMFSCGTDDATTPLNIETNPDSATLSQNTEIEIFIFQNDENIPQTGQLTLTNASKGSLTINNNNSPDNLSDDTVIYTANANTIGADTFQYTVCNASNECKTENVSVTITSSSTVVFNVDDIPYQTLSEYNFFQGDLKDLNPNFGVLPYTLNSVLFTDYAKKKRFVWMPGNTKATYINDDVSLDFPVGAVLIKNFYYDNVLPNDETHIIETRLMIRKSEGWIFANYVWNDEQTEANFNLNGSFVDMQWQENGETNTVQYRIPAGSECFTCHKIMETPEPIGPKPRNLNLVYAYSDGDENQINKLVNFGYLENTIPSNISKLPDYNDTSKPLDLRVRAYLEINCAHCHSEETHCAYRPMRFGYNDTQDYSNIGVCVDPDTDLGEGLGHIVEPGDARNSVLHFRINSTEPSTRMPLIGRSLRHTEGIELIEEWIDSLNIDCN